MPITGPRGNVRKLAYRSRGRSARSVDAASSEGSSRSFLHIRPALADPRASLARRSHTTLTGTEPSVLVTMRSDLQKQESLSFQAVGEGKVQLARSALEKDRVPDRISLDRRGLSSIPHIEGEPELRLLSLQHNLISSLAGLSAVDATKLVFLDIYDNQIEQISTLDKLLSLRVLLMGKNRIRKIEGLTTLTKLEVLDLHGNRITKVSDLSTLSELKVLNLAGNQIKNIGPGELEGLFSLRELNLKRNRIKKLLGFASTPRLHKLFLSNNDLQSVEDMSSLSLATSLQEITLDGNPVALGGDCVPFLVSHLPSLMLLTNMHITEQVRRAAMAWRRNREVVLGGAGDAGGAGGTVGVACRRDEVINNARTNWELLRSENKSLSTSSSVNKEPDLSKELIRESTPLVSINSSNNQLHTNVPDTLKTIQPVQQDLNSPSQGFKSENAETPTKMGGAYKQSKVPFNRRIRSSTARKPSERRVNFSERSASQDTDASHSTSTSSELLRLPPILLPIISSLENVKISNDEGGTVLKRCESIPSMEPVADTSISSLPSSSSESENENKKKTTRRVPTASRRRANFATVRSKSVCDPESRPRSKSSNKINVPQSDNSELASNISCSTNVASVITNSSTSGSEQTNRNIRREGSVGSRASSRTVKSATLSRRSDSVSTLGRASTARAKSSKVGVSIQKPTESIPKPVPASKDKEQGVDYLVEVCGGEVCVWGAGALRHLERGWDAAGVARASFHYVAFTNVAAALPKLKNKFPNVTHITLRATGLQWLGQLHAFAELRGIKGLTVVSEGNPIHNKQWKEYAIYRLAHWGLREVNDEMITDEELSSANLMYAGLSDVVIRALPDAPLRPLLARLGRGGASVAEGEGDGARRWLRGAEPALREVVAKEALQWRRGTFTQEDLNWRTRGQSHLSHMLDLTCDASQKLRTLELEWPSLMLEMIEDTLRDFSNMDEHVKQEIQTVLSDL